MTLPPYDALMKQLRAVPPGERDKALDACRPGIDELADMPALAAWLGMSVNSIRRERQPDRVRADGQAWPEPRKIGRTPVWTYRSIALYRASQPGPGRRREVQAGGA